MLAEAGSPAPRLATERLALAPWTLPLARRARITGDEDGRTPPLSRVLAVTLPDNPSAVAVMKKLGMADTGITRDARTDLPAGVPPAEVIVYEASAAPNRVKKPRSTEKA